MRRILIFWSVAFVVLIAAFVATVVILNASIYSASGFVHEYLDSVARHDSAAALEMPGVRTANDADTSLLADRAMGSLENIQLVRDVAAVDGTRSVIFDYSFGGNTVDRTEFLVENTGTTFGLFTTWRFVTSPLNTVSLTVLHDSSFDVNGLEITSAHDEGVPGSFVVFAPGRYTLAHDSTFLTAEPVTVEATTIGEILDAKIDVQANGEFVAKVQTDLASFLDRCATQQVLMPTGCPFGRELRNRVVTAPTWSIISYPVATIVPNDESGSWSVPNAAGIAHLTLEVRSLFDGMVSTLDEDVPFTVGYEVELRSGHTIVLTPRAG